MKEKAFSLSGDDFTVKTVAGMEVCKCKGKVMSISDKKGTPDQYNDLDLTRAVADEIASQSSLTCKATSSLH